MTETSSTAKKDCSVCRRPQLLTAYVKDARAEDGRRDVCAGCRKRRRMHKAFMAENTPPPAPGEVGCAAAGLPVTEAPYLAQIEGALAPASPAVRLQQYQIIGQAWRALAPRNGLERMIATGLIASHFATLATLGAGAHGFDRDAQVLGLKLGSRLASTFAVLVDGLDRHRGKGPRRVTVEHVHIHAGAQAVVGHVHAPSSLAVQNGGQRPHEQLTYAPGARIPPMRSQDQEGDPVPRAGDAGDASMQIPRGRINGAANGK